MGHLTRVFLVGANLRKLLNGIPNLRKVKIRKVKISEFCEQKKKKGRQIFKIAAEFKHFFPNLHNLPCKRPDANLRNAANSRPSSNN